MRAIASMTDTVLRGATIRHANLTCADMVNADMTDADSTNATMLGVKLHDDNIRRVRIFPAGASRAASLTHEVGEVPRHK